MKKILFFIPTLADGGAERVLVNLVNRMDRSKYRITVQTLFDVGRYKKELDEDIEYKYNFKKQFRGNTRIFRLFSKEFLFRHLVKGEYDIIVSYLESPTTRIVAGCEEPNTKLVSWVHNEMRDFNDFLVSFRNAKERAKCYAKFDENVFVSQTSMRSFQKYLDLKNCRVIYNTIDSDRIRKMADEAVDDIPFDEDCINLISVGRLINQKGYMRLLRIFNRLVNDDRFDNLRLVILGDGYLRDDLEKFIAYNNLTDKVLLPGFKENPYKYVKSADLFVCSSLHEGYSTAVTEALIAGTPVITTLCSGMEELLQDGKCGIITPNDEDALYISLKKLIENKSDIEKWAEKALLRGKDFSADRTVLDAQNLFDNINKSF